MSVRKVGVELASLTGNQTLRVTAKIDWVTGVISTKLMECPIADIQASTQRKGCNSVE